MNRALRAATMGVLLLSPPALAACSAGQVTQTATQERDKAGAMAQVGDITLRAVNIAYPEGGAYEAGDDATLELAIVNGSNEADTLTGITGEGFGEAVIDTAAASPSTSAAPQAPTPSGGAGAADELEIPARSTVFVGAEGGPVITLTDLDQALTTGQRVELVLTFENAGEVSVGAPVATPDEVLERDESFDFHQEEHGEGANQRDTEVAGGGNPENVDEQHG
ncbi:copper chaperone PCu(A)C [Blastococcus sp. SYSU DS0973]